MRKFRIMHNTGALKGHDVKQLCMGSLMYLFSGRLPGDDEQEALDAIFEALDLALRMTCDVDDTSIDHVREMADKTIKMTELICTFEKGAPQSELCMLVHELLHVPSAVAWWNNVRNFWVFFSERYKIISICVNSQTYNN